MKSYAPVKDTLIGKRRGINHIIATGDEQIKEVLKEMARDEDDYAYAYCGAFAQFPEKKREIVPKGKPVLLCVYCATAKTHPVHLAHRYKDMGPDDM